MYKPAIRNSSLNNTRASFAGGTLGGAADCRSASSPDLTPDLAAAMRHVALIAGDPLTSIWAEAALDPRPCRDAWTTAKHRHEQEKRLAAAEGRPPPRHPRHPYGVMARRRLYGPVPDLIERLGALNARSNCPAGVFVWVPDLPPLLPSATYAEREAALKHTADKVTGFSRITLDIDPKPDAPSLDEVMAECERRAAPPTCVVSRGHGSAQLWWRLGETYPAAAFAPTLLALAARLGGDRGATGATQLMRLAGFYRRTPTPLRLDIIHETGHIYSLDELVGALSLALGARRPSQATGPRRTGPRPGAGAGVGADQEAVEWPRLAAWGAKRLAADPGRLGRLAQDRREFGGRRFDLDELRSALAAWPRDRDVIVQLDLGAVACGLGGRAGTLSAVCALADAHGCAPDDQRDAIEHLAVTGLAELATDDPALWAEWVAGNELIWTDILARSQRPSVRRRLGFGSLFKIAEGARLATRRGDAGRDAGQGTGRRAGSRTDGAASPSWFDQPCSGPRIRFAERDQDRP